MKLYSRQEIAARRQEMWSLERFCLDWPWHDARNAAALACELISWVLPPPKWTDSDEADALNRELNAEIPVDDPYRTSAAPRVCVDPEDVTDARYEVMNVLRCIRMFVDGEPIVAPVGFGEPDEHPKARLYWYAESLSKRVRTACGHAANAVLTRAASLTPTPKGDQLMTTFEEAQATCMRWNAIGSSAGEATEFIRKFATDSATVGMIYGAGSAILHRIGIALSAAGKPTDEITGRMYHWRVKDGLKGRTLTPELEQNLRPAFEAAWSSKNYEFAYSMLADLDQITALDA